jgi:hypothetical protein
MATDKVRCLNCRTEISVPPEYAQGDHIKCGTCGTKHKVQRGEALRLVLVDLGPLKDALRANQVLTERLADELQGARRSLGIGVNGIGLGVLYLIVKVAIEERAWSRQLLFEGIAVAVVTGVLLELVNFLFLAKRQKMTRLSEELKAVREENRDIQRRIREGSAR